MADGFVLGTKESAPQVSSPVPVLPLEGESSARAAFVGDVPGHTRFFRQHAVVIPHLTSPSSSLHANAPLHPLGLSSLASEAFVEPMRIQHCPLGAFATLEIHPPSSGVPNP